MKLADGLDKVPFGIRTKLIALFVLMGGGPPFGGRVGQ